MQCHLNSNKIPDRRHYVRFLSPIPPFTIIQLFDSAREFCHDKTHFTTLFDVNDPTCDTLSTSNKSTA
jgi:hypothetical protein